VRIALTPNQAPDLGLRPEKRARLKMRCVMA
jgi:hypothetical protein